MWEKYGLTHGILVRYADDTVIICKNKKSANHALNLLRYIMAKLDLKLHPKKTKIVSMWDGKEGIDFLEKHHRRMTTETSKGQLDVFPFGPCLCGGMLAAFVILCTRGSYHIL